MAVRYLPLLGEREDGSGSTHRGFKSYPVFV
jgi:hypothetical protein